MSPMAPGSPAVFRYAAGASLVTDIARRVSPTLARPSLRPHRVAAQQDLDDAPAGSTVRRSEVGGDEAVPDGGVDRGVTHGPDGPGRIGHLGADHLRAVVDGQAGIRLVR